MSEFITPSARTRSLPPYRFDYSGITERPKIDWPDDARVAVWVAPSIEHWEYPPKID
jgi:allantoinase